MKKYMKKIYIHICSYIYMKKIGKKIFSWTITNCNHKAGLFLLLLFFFFLFLPVINNSTIFVYAIGYSIDIYLCYCIWVFNFSYYSHCLKLKTQPLFHAFLETKRDFLFFFPPYFSVNEIEKDLLEYTNASWLLY